MMLATIESVRKEEEEASMPNGRVDGGDELVQYDFLVHRPQQKRLLRFVNRKFIKNTFIDGYLRGVSILKLRWDSRTTRRNY